MPGPMDGLKLADFIRGRWPKVHLIAFSGKLIVKTDNDLASDSEEQACP